MVLSLKQSFVVQEDALQRGPVEATVEGDGGEEDVGTGTVVDEGNDVALKTRKPASRVWQFFSSRYHSAKDQRVCVKCKLCDLELTYSNTTNMHNHLVRKHSTDYLQDLASGKKVSIHVCYLP